MSFKPSTGNKQSGTRQRHVAVVGKAGPASRPRCLPLLVPCPARLAATLPARPALLLRGAHARGTAVPARRRPACVLERCRALDRATGWGTPAGIVVEAEPAWERPGPRAGSRTYLLDTCRNRWSCRCSCRWRAALRVAVEVGRLCGLVGHRKAPRPAPAIPCDHLEHDARQGRCLEPPWVGGVGGAGGHPRRPTVRPCPPLRPLSGLLRLACSRAYASALCLPSRLPYLHTPVAAIAVARGALASRQAQAQTATTRA